MSAALERDDVNGLLAGLFDANVKLDEMRRHLAAIRILLGDEPDEEESDEEAD